MRSRFAWLLAGFGIAAAVRSRLLRRTSAPTARLEPPPEPDPRADELRQRIAEAREVVDERATFEEAETTIDEVPDPESRRRDVHDRGRAALERMRRESPPE
jgi:acetyl-CoA carboxylase carboxyltransferase component